MSNIEPVSKRTYHTYVLSIERRYDLDLFMRYRWSLNDRIYAHEPKTGKVIRREEYVCGNYCYTQAGARAAAQRAQRKHYRELTKPTNHEIIYEDIKTLIDEGDRYERSNSD